MNERPTQRCAKAPEGLVGMGVAEHDVCSTNRPGRLELDRVRVQVLVREQLRPVPGRRPLRGLSVMHAETHKHGDTHYVVDLLR